MESSSKKNSAVKEIQKTSVVVDEAVYLQHTNILHPFYLLIITSYWDYS